MEEGAGGCHPQVLGIKLPQDLGWWNMHDRTEGIWGMGGGRPRQQQGHGKDGAELMQYCDGSPTPCSLEHPPPRVGGRIRASRRAGGLGADRLPQEAGKGH